MAIYHCSASNISRSAGRTATAAAAYRSGEKIKDERTDTVHDYTRKQGIEHTEIITPFDTPIDRAQLWNAAEQAERRKDARTAKEFVIALPHELNKEQRQELALAFARDLVERYQCTADIAIHAPSRQSEDDRNHHAHILLTTRKTSLNANGELVLGEKTELELSNAKRKALGLKPTTDEIQDIRQSWEKLANAHLERAGSSARIDSRSYAEQGNGKQAQIHETPQVTAMRRKGKQTEITQQNDVRKAYNAEIDRQAQAEKQSRQAGIIENARASLESRLQERERERQRKAEAERQAQERARREQQERIQRETANTPKKALLQS